MGLLETAITGRKRHNSHAVVVGELGLGIVAGTIPEGSILPGDNELSLRFGVSRTVLREAMKTLAAKRLIEPKAKVGTRVLGHASWNFFDPDVLTWRFEAGFDEVFVDHLAEMRMAQVCQLLRTSSLPLAAVAQRCGYADQSVMTHAMRKLRGTTPAAYRKNDLSSDAD